MRETRGREKERRELWEEGNGWKDQDGWGIRMGWADGKLEMQETHRKEKEKTEREGDERMGRIERAERG